MTKKQFNSSTDFDLKNALQEERTLFEKVEVPIVTISATYRKELADRYYSLVHTPAEVIYSRGHYSMAEAVRQQAIRMKKSVQLSDPTNFVSKKDWRKIEFTEKIGLLAARNKLFKIVKNKLNSFIRGNLPISKAIAPPLLFLTEKTSQPIISMHYETGNILAQMKKTVIQAVTDPHVHPQYLDKLPSLNITFAVFDEKTKEDFLKLAKNLNKEIDENQVVVTGPFIDPRILDIGKKKKIISKEKPVNLAIVTGGLGTNLNEIKELLKKLEVLLIPPEKIRLFLYAGTHRDFRSFFEDYAMKNNIRIGNLNEEDARIRILYEDSIIDANENLIKYMFPWAHGIITKPSGDMAYDAVAAGCFLFFLEPWGEWENNVKKIFIKYKIGYDLKTDDPYHYFLHLLNNGRLSKSLSLTHSLPSLFYCGCKNLIKLQESKAFSTNS